MVENYASSSSTMNYLFRPILRSTAVRPAVLVSKNRPLPVSRPAFVGLTPTTIHARHVASQVSNRPGSQSLEHAATNVKEEIGNSAADLAKVIAGANVTAGIADSSADSFVRFDPELGEIRNVKINF